MVASQLARGEKEHMVVRNLCETLLKTGSSSEIVATTMMGCLRKILQRGECDIMKDIGRTLFEQGIRGTHPLTSASLDCGRAVDPGQTGLSSNPLIAHRLESYE